MIRAVLLYQAQTQHMFKLLPPCYIFPTFDSIELSFMLRFFSQDLFATFNVEVHLVSNCIRLEYFSIFAFSVFLSVITRNQPQKALSECITHKSRLLKTKYHIFNCNHFHYSRFLDLCKEGIQFEFQRIPQEAKFSIHLNHQV